MILSTDERVTLAGIQASADHDLPFAVNVNLDTWHHFLQQPFQIVNGLCIVDDCSEGKFVGVHRDLVTGDH